MAERRTSSGISLVLLGIVSVQVGSAIAKNVFGLVPPVSMAWLRMTSAVLALGVARTLTRRVGRRHGGTTTPPPRQWRPLLAYAVLLVGMNTSFYLAIARLNVGIAVTIEFLGPLAVAVAGCRRARDLLWPALALAGVALLGFTPTRLDPVGVVLVLVAATCWAGYILMATRVGASWNALDALLAACALGMLVLAAPALLQGGPGLLQTTVLLAGAAVGVMSTAIPYSLEIVALKSVPQRVFGILMSLEPAAAALAALLLLGERLSGTDLLAMACVIAASIGVTRSAGAAG